MNKQKVLEILEDLKSHRDLADGMIALIEAGFMDKETYQNMLFMVASAIKKMPEGEEKENLKEKLESLKDKEEKKIRLIQFFGVKFGNIIFLTKICILKLLGI